MSCYKLSDILEHLRTFDSRSALGFHFGNGQGERAIINGVNVVGASDMSLCVVFSICHSKLFSCISVKRIIAYLEKAHDVIGDVNIGYESKGKSALYTKCPENDLKLEFVEIIDESDEMEKTSNENVDEKRAVSLNKFSLGEAE